MPQEAPAVGPPGSRAWVLDQKYICSEDKLFGRVRVIKHVINENKILGRVSYQAACYQAVAIACHRYPILWQASYNFYIFSNFYNLTAFQNSAESEIFPYNIWPHLNIVLKIGNADENVFGRGRRQYHGLSG